MAPDLWRIYRGLALAVGTFNVAYGAQEHENFEVLSKKHGIPEERVLEMVAHIHRILDRYHAYLTEKIILAQADTSSSGHWSLIRCPQEYFGERRSLCFPQFIRRRLVPP